MSFNNTLISECISTTKFTSIYCNCVECELWKKLSAAVVKCSSNQLIVSPSHCNDANSVDRQINTLRLCQCNNLTSWMLWLTHSVPLKCVHSISEPVWCPMKFPPTSRWLTSSDFKGQILSCHSDIFSPQLILFNSNSHDKIYCAVCKGVLQCFYCSS